MILTKSPIYLHDPAGPMPWPALVLRFFRRSSPSSSRCCVLLPGMKVVLLAL